MKKVCTLLLLLAALLSDKTQSNAQVIYAQNFDTTTFAFSKPTGWTDSVFAWPGYNSSYPYGYPTWYQDNLGPGCFTTFNGTSRYYYYPFGFSYPQTGPYGTTVGYTYHYPYPSSNSGTSGCLGAGYMAYSAYYNGLQDYYITSYGATPANFFPFSAEIASPAMNFNTTYQANSGQGSIRLSFFLQTYYYYTLATNQVKVYINSAPVSSGGTLIDSIYPYANPASGYSFNWTKFQYTLPSSYNTSTKAYIIFVGSVGSGALSGYYSYDLDMDDFAVTFIPPCPVPATQPTSLLLPASASIVNGSFTASSPAAAGYLVVRSIGSLSGVPQNSTTYSVGNTFGANGTVVSVSTGTTFTDPGLTPGTNYTYTVFSISTGATCTVTYNTTNPLVNNVTTGSTSIYTWNKNVAASFTTPTSWTPTRVVPDPTDILVFDNGISDTAINVPVTTGPYTQGIGRLSIANTTQAHFRSSTSSASTLTLNANGVANAVGLDIAAGSGLILDGTTALTLNFGAGTLPVIAGNLEVSNTNGLNYIDFSNAITTITAAGQLAGGGTITSNPFNSTTANLIINGTYNHKYTSVAGTVPVATWNPGATFLVSGYTTSVNGPSSGLNQVFPNFVYNASSQTSVVNWNGNALNVTGTFNVTSTGTGVFALAGTQAYTTTLNNFVQAGGIIDLATGTGVAPNTQVLAVSGTFNQLGGNIRSSGATTTQPILFFNGTGGTQNVTLSNAPAGPIVYRVSNAGGINLLGINSLGSTPVLAINSGGGVRISTTAAIPINTSLLLNYFPTNTTLTYDTSGNITATLAVFPPTSSPFNVVINVNTGNTVRLPFNATIPGTLTFQSGDLDVNSNNLTVGNSTLSTNQGNIVEPTTGSPFLNVLGNGNVRLTTGSLTRWYGTAALPITGTGNAGLTSQGFFPISYGPSNRNVFVYFSASNALAAGGTITLTHNPATGLSAVAPIADGTYTINTRTNASWTFTTGNSLTLNASVGGTFSIKTTAGSLINPINSLNMRLTRTGVTVDPGVNGGAGGFAPNFTASRTGLQGIDLTGGPWYFGANSTDINTGTNGVYTQTTTGLWTTASNWDINAVPTVTKMAVINPGVTSYVTTATAAAKALTVLGTLSDTLAAGSLNVDSELVNNGTVLIKGSGKLLLNTNVATYDPTLNQNVGIYNYGSFIINGGTVTIGPAGGGSKPFQNYAGLTLGANAGTALNINGSFASLPGSFFTQQGGAFRIDGNAAGVLANSVPHGRSLFSLQTGAINLYGGTINVVDPGTDVVTNFLGGPQTSFEYNPPTGTPAYNDSAAHTFIFGDPLNVSTDVGGNFRGFYLLPQGSGTGLFNFSNLVVNGGPGVNRSVNVTTSLCVNRLMTINNGGEYRMSNRDLVLNGNLVVNAGGKLTTDDTGTLTFGQLVLNGGPNIAPATPAVAPQMVTGTGIFANANTTIANLGNIKTLSPPYVVFNTGANLSFSSADKLTFTPVNAVPSRIIMATGNLAETGALGTSNNASAINGWVVGTYQKHAVTGGGMVGTNFKFPIGDSNNYTPVVITGTATNVIAAGDISVSTKPVPASTLSFSSFNPLKLVNRTYIITTTPSLVLAPNTVKVTFNYVPLDITATANYQNFKVGVNPYGTTWYYPHFTGAAATSITIDSLAPTGLAGIYQVGEACPPTVITTQPLSTSACLGGAPVSFSVAATGASLQYQWYHSNSLIGTMAIAGANSTTYTTVVPNSADSGRYDVVITGACALPDTSNIVTYVFGGGPPISTQPVSKTVCVGYPVTFTVAAVNATTYRWQKNNVDVPGTTTANLPTLTIGYVTSLDTGRYIVIVGNSCASDTSLVAVLNIVPLPTASVTTNTPLAFCPGSNVLLAANSGAGFSYQWKNDGIAIPGVTTQVFAATYGGNFSVAVTDANSCTSTSASDSVTVFPSPSVSDSATGPTTFCVGGSVQLVVPVPNSSYTYHWQLNGVNMPGNSVSTYNATTSGNYSVTVSDLNGCTSTTPAILVNALPVPSGAVIASGSTSLCANTSVLLTAPAGTIYQWYNNGVAINGQTNVSYQAVNAGSYSAIVSNGYCADTTQAVSVTQFPLPGTPVAVSGPTTFCQGGTVILSAGTGIGVSYQWQKDNINQPNTSDSFVANLTGNYSVVLSNAAGCSSASAPVFVQVNPLPQPVITDNNGGATLSTSNSFTTYQWYVNNVPVASGGNSSTYTAPSGGKYTVYVTNGNGCSNMSPAFTYIPTGVNNVANKIHVRVYPNPARDVVYIEAPMSVNVSVNGVDGKELFNKQNAKSINIADLANGIYMIRISDADGNLISVEKLVKADN
jgi:hypothetical protein